MIVELKSATDAVIYDGISGDILEISSNLVLPGIPTIPGSVVEVILWSMKTEEGKVQSLCQFEVNGIIMSSRSLVLNGYNIIPSIYVSNMEIANIKTSKDENKSKSDQITNIAGRYPYFSLRNIYIDC